MSPTTSPSPSPTALPTEYVTNIGFEDGTEAGWNGIYTAKSSTNTTQDAAQSGSWSLAITSSATTISTVGTTSKPPVIASTVAGTELTGAVSVQTNEPGLSVTQLIWETAPDGTTVGYQSRSISLPDTGWHRIRVRSPYIVMNDGDTLWFSLYATNLPAGGVFYADNFSLTSPN